MTSSRHRSENSQTTQADREESQVGGEIHYVHELLQEGEDEEALTLETGENWLRLLSPPGSSDGYSVLDATQDATPQWTPYPSILSLCDVGKIEAPTKDCYLCIDVDGPVMSIKDMRCLLSDALDSDVEICIQRIKSPGLNENDLSELLQSEGDYNLYHDLDELPRRQMKVLCSGDRVCTRLGSEVGLVLRYKRTESKERPEGTSQIPTSQMSEEQHPRCSILDVESKEELDIEDDKVTEGDAVRNNGSRRQRTIEVEKHQSTNKELSVISILSSQTTSGLPITQDLVRESSKAEGKFAAPDGKASDIGVPRTNQEHDAKASSSGEKQRKTVEARNVPIPDAQTSPKPGTAKEENDRMIEETKSQSQDLLEEEESATRSQDLPESSSKQASARDTSKASHNNDDMDVIDEDDQQEGENDDEEEEDEDKTQLFPSPHLPATQSPLRESQVPYGHSDDDTVPAQQAVEEAEDFVDLPNTIDTVDDEPTQSFPSNDYPDIRSTAATTKTRKEEKQARSIKKDEDSTKAKGTSQDALKRKSQEMEAQERISQERTAVAELNSGKARNDGEEISKSESQEGLAKEIAREKNSTHNKTKRRDDSGLTRAVPTIEKPCQVLKSNEANEREVAVASISVQKQSNDNIADSDASTEADEGGTVMEVEQASEVPTIIPNDGTQMFSAMMDANSLVGDAPEVEGTAKRMEIEFDSAFVKPKESGAGSPPTRERNLQTSDPKTRGQDDDSELTETEEESSPFVSTPFKVQRASSRGGRKQIFDDRKQPSNNNGNQSALTVRSQKRKPTPLGTEQVVANPSPSSSGKGGEGGSEGKLPSAKNLTARGEEKQSESNKETLNSDAAAKVLRRHLSSPRSSAAERSRKRMKRSASITSTRSSVGKEEATMCNDEAEGDSTNTAGRKPSLSVEQQDTTDEQSKQKLAIPEDPRTLDEEKVGRAQKRVALSKEKHMSTTEPSKSERPEPCIGERDGLAKYGETTISKVRTEKAKISKAQKESSPSSQRKTRRTRKSPREDKDFDKPDKKDETVLKERDAEVEEKAKNLSEDGQGRKSERKATISSLDNKANSNKEEPVTNSTGVRSSRRTPRKASARRTTSTESAPKSTRKRAREASSTTRTPGRTTVRKRDRPTDTFRILATCVDITSKHKRMIATLGARLVDKVEDAASATHVIAGDSKTSMRRTPKLMIALCATPNILHMSWLEQSGKAGHFLPTTDDHLLLEDKKAEKQYGFNMRMTLQRGKNLRVDGRNLFTSYSIFVCKGVGGKKAPPAKELKLIVEAAGGTWMLAASDLKNAARDRTIVITSDPPTKTQLSSPKDVDKAIKNGIRHETTTWMFNCIMRQQVD